LLLKYFGVSLRGLYRVEYSEATQKLTEVGVQVVQENQMEMLGLTKDHAYAVAGAPSITRMPLPELLRSFSRTRTVASFDWCK
jgi:hypothetical protein